MAQFKDTNVADTGSISLPAGTTAQRPSSPQAGMIRYNTTLNETEYYDGSVWRNLTDVGAEGSGGTIVDSELGGVSYRSHIFKNTGNNTFTVTKGGEVEYLIVAGGGAGGGRHGGGGGAGGLLTGFTTVQPGNYNITVGAGGAGVTGICDAICGRAGGNGGNSSAFGLTAIGGGGGGSNNQSPQNGGSGGGDGNGNGFGTGVPGQGNNGAVGLGSPQYPGGGGGGAASPGEMAYNNSSPGGNGGHGLASNLSGVNTYYAGGGGGGHWSNGTPGKGGLGGGGNGGTNAGVNTGGGGGGGIMEEISGNGGSGIVIVRYRRNKGVTTAPSIILNSSVPNISPFTPDSPAPSARVITDMGLPNGWYWVDLGGPRLVYVNTKFDGGGWYLIIQNNINTGNGIGAINYIDATSERQLFANATAGNDLNTFNLWTGMRLWETMTGGRDTGGQVAQVVFTRPTDLDGKFTKRATWTYTGFGDLWGFQGAGNVSSTSNNPGMYSYHAVNGYNLTTTDRDQDASGSNCPDNYGGTPFWYGACWSGNAWGGGNSGGYQNAYYWVGSGTDYHNYGATYVRPL